MRIYFAAPLFNVAEQRFNARLTWQLEELNHRVFLPQRDGLEMAAVDPGDPAAAEQRRRVFELDTSEILAADLVLAVLDGRVPDEGVAFELGLAWALGRMREGGRPTDDRRATDRQPIVAPERPAQPDAERGARRDFRRRGVADRLVTNDLPVPARRRTRSRR
ncbi:MAG TPA: nucleoside 2-deoxyribosyltransferase [Thermomicrobiales bacterium]|jgi:nucleoside 2-deoxyribosyltransferase|nr:nucleoside 2-deoxyribosyltransferase [Thermomicrobiales bacterium]